MTNNTMADWREVKLGDLGEIITGKTPSTKVDTYWGKNIPFVTPKDIQGSKHILETERYLTDEGMLSVKGSILPPNTVCVSCIGNIGYVSMTTKKSVSNQQINSIIANDENDANFIYYLIKSLWPYFKNYEGQSTTVSILNKSQFSKISVNIPPVEVQRKIAGVLGALDDKIELNNKINQNLELQAQALFKSWFVDFEPFGGTMPADWKNGKLGDFIEIKRGGSPRPIQNYLVPKGLNWLKISDATAETSPYILEVKEHIKQEGLSKTVFLQKGSLVLSNSATPGIPKFLNVDSCIHDGWLYFPKSQLSKEYLFLLFNSIRKDLIAFGNGSVFTNLKTDILRNYKAVLPAKEVLQNFDNTICPIFDLIRRNREEIATLTALRDTLLPKLMSGEINVDKVDI